MTDDPKQQTIDAIWPVARAAARHYREWHTPERNGDSLYFNPHHWDGKSYIAAAWAKPGEIEYRVNQHASVSAVNIRIAEVMADNIDIGPITPTGPQRTIRADVISIPNDTLQDLERELKYRDLQAQGTAQNVAREVGASLSLGFRQSIGYGSELYGIQGETELTMNFEASIKQAWESAMTGSVEHEMESVTNYVARALHRTTLERVEQVGPARQVIKATGELKFGFQFHIPGTMILKWDTTPIYLAQAVGVETEGQNKWVSYYRKYPSPQHLLEPIKTPVYSTVEKVREFEEARSIELVPREEPINDTARFQDALKLVALKGEDPELRRLAEAALAA